MTRESPLPADVKMTLGPFAGRPLRDVPAEYLGRVVTDGQVAVAGVLGSAIVAFLDWRISEEGRVIRSNDCRVCGEPVWLCVNHEQQEM